jgi:hypothetical protein
MSPSHRVPEGTGVVIGEPRSFGPHVSVLGAGLRLRVVPRGRSWVTPAEHCGWP